MGMEEKKKEMLRIYYTFFGYHVGHRVVEFFDKEMAGCTRTSVVIVALFVVVFTVRVPSLSVLLAFLGLDL